MKFSKFQEDIFNWVENEKGSAVVEAVAGSGKTTTIVHAAGLVNPTNRVLFLAFNRNIADELKRRLPKHVEARTLNSLGAGILFKHMGRRELNPDKLKRIIKEVCLTEIGESGYSTFKYPLQIVLKKIRTLGLRPDEIPDDVQEEIEDEIVSSCDDLSPEFIRGFQYEGLNFFQYLNYLTDRCVEGIMTAKDLDFDDQLYIPVYHGWRMRPFDFIFVDECQDLSPVNRKLLKLVSGPRTRFCFVGDRAQAIYAFRGADSLSMSKINEEFNTKTLPLSICYRCPTDVVEMAKIIVPQIEAAPEQPRGVVSTQEREFNHTIPQINDLIVCRLNAPLVKAALILAKSGKRCVILGRDLGKNLTTLVRNLRVADINELPNALEGWMDKKIRMLYSMGRDDDSLVVQEVRDKYETIMFFFQELMPTSVEEFCVNVESWFSDKEDGRSVVLSTIHKAKGKEYDRVFVLDGGKIGAFPEKGNKPSQEPNLLYVAVTRAKKELFFLNLCTDVGSGSPLYTGVIQTFNAKVKGGAT